MKSFACFFLLIRVALGLSTLCPEKNCRVQFKKVNACPTFFGEHCKYPCDKKGCIIKWKKLRHHKSCKFIECQEKENEDNETNFGTSVGFNVFEDFGIKSTKSSIFTRTSHLGTTLLPRKTTIVPIPSKNTGVTAVSKKTGASVKMKTNFPVFSDVLKQKIKRFQQVSQIFPQWIPGVNEGPMPKRFMSILKNAWGSYLQQSDEDIEVQSQKTETKKLIPPNANIWPSPKLPNRTSSNGLNRSRIQGKEHQKDVHGVIVMPSKKQQNSSHNHGLKLIRKQEKKHQGDPQINITRNSLKKQDMKIPHGVRSNQSQIVSLKLTKPVHSSQQMEGKNLECKKQRKKTRKLEQWNLIQEQVNQYKKIFYSRRNQLSLGSGNDDVMIVQETTSSRIGTHSMTEETKYWQDAMSNGTMSLLLTFDFATLINVLIITIVIVLLAVVAIITVLLLFTKAPNKAYKSPVPSNDDNNIELINLNTL